MTAYEVMFYGTDSNGTFGLWITDGAAQGTYELTGVTGTYYSGLAPSNFASFNGEVYFDGSDPNGGSDLWVTNGTAAGTHAITGISGALTYGTRLQPSDLTSLGSKLLFSGFDSSDQQGLWVSDGTAGGTQELSSLTDIYGGTITNIRPQDLTVFNGEVAFDGYDSKSTLGGLWITDGTQAGTHEIVHGSGVGAYPRALTVLGNELLFEGQDSLGYGDLWVTDGTVSGAHEVTGILGESNLGLSPYDMTTFGSEVLLTGADATHSYDELWVTNGTATGTYELTGITGADTAGLQPQDITTLIAPDASGHNGKALFFGEDASGNYGLWVTDGTSGGTQELSGNGGIPEFGATSFAVLNGEALFYGIGSDGSRALWETDGTVAGTHEITGISGAYPSGLYPHFLTTVALAPVPPTVTISSPGGITNKATQTISGTVTIGGAPIGSSVTIDDNGVQAGTASVVNGSWSANVTLSEGANNLTASDTDAAGNTGTSTLVTYDLATHAPTASAAETASGFTHQTSDTITVTASAEAVPGNAISGVQIYDGTTNLGAATADSNGAWSYITGALTDGSHSFTALVTDAAGNQTTTTALPAFTVAPPDNFDGGAVSDLLAWNPATGNVADFTASSAPALQYIAWIDPNSGYQIAGSGDFYGNGTSDILLANSSGQIGEFQMNNNHATWQGIGLINSGAGWAVAGAGDFYGNGTDDILIANASAGLIGEFEMNSGAATWQGIGTVNATAGWAVAGAGDFFGNGTDDILLANQSQGQIGMFAVDNGAASWQGIGTVDASAGWAVAGTGDFFGNGTDDILLANSSTGALGMFVMHNGQAAWQSIGSIGAGWQVAGTGDYFGNGTSDILLQNPTTGGIGMFAMNNGVASWQGIASLPTGWHVS
jgi:ELWxxDGT repeat protein